MNSLERAELPPIRTKKYTIALMVTWTVILSTSLLWNIFQERMEILDVARIQARTAFEKDLLCRRWSAVHGGLYAPITATTQPNPYLNVPERDIETPSGLSLTLINPAYMTRQVHELAATAYGVLGHITSLDPIRPENGPDPWEAQALRTFQDGTEEVSSLEELQSGQYMRLMRPLVTEGGCLKCHAAQGYEIGDVRGGISVSIPMAPLWAILRSGIVRLSVAHGALWLIGLVGIGAGMGRIGKQIHERKQAEEVLNEQERYFRSLLYALHEDILVISPDYTITDVNNTFLVTTGLKREEVIGTHCFEASHGYHEPCHERGEDCKLREVLATGEPRNCKHEHRHKDGSTVYVDILISPLKDTSGNVTHVVEAVRDVTDIIEAEEALRESERKYRSLFEDSKDAFLITTEEGTFVDVNQAMMDLFGYSKNEMLKMKVQELYVDANERKRFIQRVKQEGSVEDYETELRKKDGSVITCLLTSVARLGEDKSTFVYEGIIRNVTEQKELERELTLRNRAIDESSEGIAIIDPHEPDNPLVYANKGFETLTGYYKQEVLGCNLSLLQGPDTDQDTFGRIEKAITERKEHATEILHYRKDGTAFWNHLSISPVKDENGRITHYIAILSDVTERKQAEEALRLQAEITANMSEGAHLTRANDGVIVYSNPKLEKMFGYGPGEMLGKHVSVLNSPTKKSPEEMAQEIMDILEVEGAWSGEFQNIKKDGTPFWCYTNVSYFDHPEHGRVLVAVHTDITERKQLQSQLIQAQKMESLGTLVAGVAHEINNPVNAIKFNAPLFQKIWQDVMPIVEAHAAKEPDKPYGGLPYDFLKENLEQLLADINISADRIIKIVTSLKSFSRQSDLAEREPVQINETIRNALGLTQATLVEHAIEVNLNLEDELPEIEGDLQSVEQILLNLIVNATQAIENDEGKLAIASRYEKKGRRVIVEVTDNGRGIDPAIRDRVFDPFATTRQSEGGTGLGLSVTYSLVEAHKGTISFKSKKGKGTTFRVSFPVGDGGVS